jgi:hypothetical protein
MTSNAKSNTNTIAISPFTWIPSRSATPNR